MDVLALHFPSVTPVMSMEDKAAAILAAVCSQLGRAVPLTADQVRTVLASWLIAPSWHHCKDNLLPCRKQQQQ